jgi:pyruvate, water dikinase
VGDRAWLLQALMQMGYSVLSGFVLPHAFLDAFTTAIVDNRAIPQAHSHLEPPQFDGSIDPARLEGETSLQLQQMSDRLAEALSGVKFGSDRQQVLETALYNSALRQGIPTVLLSLSFPSLPAAAAPLFSSQLCLAEVSDVLQGIIQLYQEQIHPRMLLYWQCLGIDWINQPARLPFSILIQPIAGAIASGHLSLDALGGWVDAYWGLPWHGIASLALPEQYVLSHADCLTALPPLASQTLAYALPSHPLPSSIAPHLAQPGADISPLYPYWIQPKEPILQGSRELGLRSLMQQLQRDWATDLQATWLLLADRVTSQETLILLALSTGASLRSMHSLTPAVSTKAQCWVGAAVGHRHCQGTAIVVSNQHSRVPLPNPLPAQAIIISPSLSPQQVLQLRGAIGLILETGGLTSHTAILAREMGMHVIVGVSNAAQVLHTGDRLLLQGAEICLTAPAVVPSTLGESTGILSEVVAEGSTIQVTAIDASAMTSWDFLERSDLVRVASANQGQHPEKPLEQSLEILLPFIATQLWVNLNYPDRALSLATTPVDGVGLVRSELLLLSESLDDRNVPSGADAQALAQHWHAQLVPILQAFAPRPVFYRMLDWSAKTGSLGLHGTQQYLKNPAWFEWELARLRELQLQGFNNLRLLLPFVRTVEEFRICRSRIQQARLFEQPGFELWMMAEVPSVVFTLADFIAAGVQGILIGSGDLSYLLLAQDRESSQSVSLSQPAVIAALCHLIQTACQHQIPCHLCLHGITQEQAVIDQVIRQGVTGLSVEPDAIPYMVAAIARAERRLLIDQAR